MRLQPCREARRTALAIFAIALALLSSPDSALAHAHLVRSDPSAGARVRSPSSVRLSFSEMPVLTMTRMRLITVAGDTVLFVRQQIDSADGHVVVATVNGILAPGKYKVLWSTAGRDGHPSTGSFGFVVIPTSVTPDVKVPVPLSADSAVHAPLVASAPAEPLMGTGESVVAVLGRWIGYVSIFLIVGAVTLRFAVLDNTDIGGEEAFQEIAATNAASLGMFASVGSLLSVVLKVVRESADMPDIPTSTMVLGTGWGWSLIVAATASLVAAPAFARAHGKSGAQRSGGWTVALAAAVVLVVCPAFAGHAAASDRSWLMIPVDVIHVAAGSAWLGTLTVIVLVGMSAALKASDGAPAGARVARLINKFSPMALTCGAFVVGTGLIATLFHLPRFNALWTTPYGAMLYKKLMFVLFLFAVGAWNWRRMKPRLGQDSALGSLRRSATLELALAAVVLALTAILVALALPD